MQSLKLIISSLVSLGSKLSYAPTIQTGVEKKEINSDHRLVHLIVRSRRMLQMYMIFMNGHDCTEKNYHISLLNYYEPARHAQAPCKYHSSYIKCASRPMTFPPNAGHKKQNKFCGHLRAGHRYGPPPPYIPWPPSRLPQRQHPLSAAEITSRHTKRNDHIPGGNKNPATCQT